MLWIICSSILCLAVCLPLFLHYKMAMQLPLACAFKALGTACAVMLVLVAAIKLDQRCWICFAGMVLHLIGDIFLEISFFIGAGLFMAGHIAYIAFFMNLYSFSPPHIFCFIFLLAFGGFLLYQWRKQAGRKISFFAVYGAVLCAMSASALAGGLASYTTPGILIAAGGMLFFLSDIFLARRMLFPSPRIIHWVIMILYYGAQLLFGAACMLM